MGYTFADYDLGGLHYLIDGNYVEYNSLQYDTSWDWLMPVVEKILKDNMSCCNYGAPHYCSGQEGWYFIILDDQKNCQQAEGESMLEATYKAVVEFIKEYN